MRPLLAFLLLLLAPACSLLGAAEPAPCRSGAPVDAPRAAGCLVVHEGRLLLVRTRDGWSFPAGYLEPGEASAVGAARETREEAGLTVRAGPVACGVPSRGFVAHTCTLAGPAPPRAHGAEVLEVRWVDAEGLAELPDDALRFPEQRPALRQALSEAATSP